jgi:isoquinoline 1-oxidoreductase beta subunit
MEPMNCTARVTADSCELWVPTQAAYLVQEAAAELTGLPLSSITVHTPPIGGGFGRKAEVDHARQAVRIAMAVGRPVNLIWPRAEDIRHDRYRPAFAAGMTAGLTADGDVMALQAKIAGQPISETPLVDFFAIAGLSDIPYSIPHMRMRLVETDVGIPVGYWRSIGHSHNSFFVESFMDELAEAAGKDSLAFRRQHLSSNSRAVAVLDAVKDLSGWGTPKTAGSSQGIGFLSMAKSYVAMVIEAAVVNGAVTTYRVCCAIDCGQVLNPDLVKAQLEGGIVFGLSAALWGEMTISGGQVAESNFSDYRIMGMSDMPVIETMVMDSTESPGGVGELGVPLCAPALTNALYAATGTRIRSLPLSRHSFA